MNVQGMGVSPPLPPMRTPAAVVADLQQWSAPPVSQLLTVAATLQTPSLSGKTLVGNPGFDPTSAIAGIVAAGQEAGVLPILVLQLQAAVAADDRPTMVQIANHLDAIEAYFSPLEGWLDQIAHDTNYASIQDWGNTATPDPVWSGLQAVYLLYPFPTGRSRMHADAVGLRSYVASLPAIPPPPPSNAGPINVVVPSPPVAATAAPAASSTTPLLVGVGGAAALAAALAAAAPSIWGGGR